MMPEGLIITIVIGGLFGLLAILVVKNQRSLNRNERSRGNAEVSAREISDRESFETLVLAPKAEISIWQKRRTKITGIDLSGIEARNADFRYYQFESVDFNSANLQGCNLSQSNLRNVDFSYADLTGCDLSGAKTWGDTNFRYALLTGSNLQFASLPEKLEGADLMGASIQSASFHVGTDLTRVVLLGARYNFFTDWAFGDPLTAEAISEDGLGPNPKDAKQSEWYKYEVLRKASLRKTRELATNSGLGEVISRDAVQAKLAYAIENPDIDKAIANWGEISLENLYYRAAHEILYLRQVFGSAPWPESQKAHRIGICEDAWIDALEYYEIQNPGRSPFEPSVSQSDAGQIPEPNFDSPIEEMFWNEWQRQGGKSRIDLTYQYKVPDTRYRIDFAYVPKMIAIELDGHEFHSSKEQFTRDRQRQRLLERQGWRVMRFSGSEIVGNVKSCFSEALNFIENIE